MSKNVPLLTRSLGGAYDVIYYIEDDGMGFRTVRPSPRRQVSNVAPRIRIGGDSGYSTDAFDQHVINDFSVGGDLDIFESGENRYYWSDGRVALHIQGRAQLAAKWDVIDSGVAATAPQIFDFVPNMATMAYVVMAAGTKLRVWNANTLMWSDQGTFAANAIHIFTNNTYVFIACGAGDDFWRWDGTLGGGMTKPAAGVKAHCFGWYKQTLFRAYGASLFPATNNDGSAWGTAIAVGWPNTNIEDMWEGAGYLFLAKPEGIFVYDGTAVYRIVDAEDTYASGNFKGGTEWQGAIYVPWISAVYKMAVASQTKATVTDITPRMKGDIGKERYGHGTPIRLFSGPHKIYCAFTGGEGVYPELLSYNGVGWHQLYRGSSGATMLAAGYSRLMGWLIINDGSTRRKRIMNTVDGEYPDFNLTGQFTTPKYNGGYPDEMKAWRDITVKVRDVDTNNTVKVEYSIDDGNWVDVGTITKNGSNQLALGQLSTQVSGRAIRFRITLTRDSSDVTKTPVVEFPIIIRMLVTPAAIDAYSDVLIVDEEQELYNGYGNVGDVYTVQAMMDFVDILADTPKTVRRLDEFGRIQYVKPTDVALDRVRLPDGREQIQVAMRMMEMFSGLVRTFNTREVVTISATASKALGSNVYDGRRYELGGYE